MPTALYEVYQTPSAGADKTHPTDFAKICKEIQMCPISRFNEAAEVIVTKTTAIPAAAVTLTGLHCFRKWSLDIGPAHARLLLTLGSDSC